HRRDAGKFRRSAGGDQVPDLSGQRRAGPGVESQGRGDGGLVQRFRGTNHIDIILQPRPEERAPELVEGCARLEGRPQARSCPRPSFETAALRARPPQDEVREKAKRGAELQCPTGTFVNSSPRLTRSTRCGASRAPTRIMRSAP